MASPMPATMMPMFSIDEYARRRFMSDCTAANTTPNSAVQRPSASATTPHHHNWTSSRSKVTRSTP